MSMERVSGSTFTPPPLHAPVATQAPHAAQATKPDTPPVTSQYKIPSMIRKVSIYYGQPD